MVGQGVSAVVVVVPTYQKVVQELNDLLVDQN
jgi:hypothetical protein